MYNLDTDDDACPLEFIESLGDNRLTDEVRRAFIWACIERFATEDYPLPNMVEEDNFDARDRSLAKSVSFHGPYDDEGTAEEEANQKMGIICTPLHMWDSENKPHWVVCLAH